MSPRVAFCQILASRSAVEIRPSSIWSTIAFASSRIVSKASVMAS
jgi:hypothetical protein